MKIMVIHQYFLTQGDSGGSRWNQFAKYFTQAGHEVTVIAGMVSHIGSRKEPQYKGKFVVREKDPSGANVIRCHVSEAYNKSFIGRFWAYLCFAFSSLWAGLFVASRPDVIIATSPPLTVALPMVLLGRLRRVPAVFEVRDLWPESAIDTGVLTSKPLIWLSVRIDRLACREAKWINALTPAFVDALVEKKGVPRSRISMIPNGADLDIMRPGPKENAIRQELGLNGKFVISYFGAHGRANKLWQLLDVAERIKDTMPDVQLLLVGDGMEKQKLIDEGRRRGLINVTFVDAVAKTKVHEYINASNICTAVLMKNDTFKTVYPNKVFDYMSCKRPIIIAIDGVARALVEDAKAGLFAEPENPEAFENAVRTMREDPGMMHQMGEDGYAYASAHYSREACADKYLATLADVISSGKRTR